MCVSSAAGACFPIAGLIRASPRFASDADDMKYQREESAGDDYQNNSIDHGGGGGFTDRCRAIAAPHTLIAPRKCDQDTVHQTLEQPAHYAAGIDRAHALVH